MMRLVIRCSRATSVSAVPTRACCRASSSMACVRTLMAWDVLDMGGSVLFFRSVVGVGRIDGGSRATVPEQSAVVGLQTGLGPLDRVGAAVVRIQPLLQLVLGDERLGGVH